MKFGARNLSKYVGAFLGRNLESDENIEDHENMLSLDT